MVILVFLFELVIPVYNCNLKLSREQRWKPADPLPDEHAYNLLINKWKKQTNKQTNKQLTESNHWTSTPPLDRFYGIMMQH